MNEEMKDFKFANSLPVTLTYYFVAISLFIGYIYIYQYAPLGGSLNDIVLNAITALSALLVAVIATAIYLHYHPEDFPRKVWLHLMIGCWFWFLGETIWGVIAVMAGEVLVPSIADACWIGGFVFFTIAFYYQYVIIFPSQKKRIINVAIGAWIFAIFVPLVVLLATHTFTFESLVNYYYPIADLAVGIAGIALVFVFQGGALMRPWLGLVVFGVSDLFYAWAEQTGLYAWSSEGSSQFALTLTLAIDASYLAAYLILGVGFLGHWILINYGLNDKR